MKTKKIFLSCIALSQICIALSQNPTTFPNSIRLPNVDESETITDSTKVAVIDDNGIVKYVEKGDISEEVTQYFLSITEGTHPGYAHKYRADNPDNYGNLGRDAVDLSFSTASSTIRGATGLNSFAAGRNTTASGDQSLAMGDGSQATGIRSIAIGSGNTASGSYSTAIGSQNTASDGYAVALGRSNVASRLDATAMGYGNTASGQMSTAMGRGNTANSVFSTFIGGWGTVFEGQNHITWIATDILFNVGNGVNGSSRSNALSLFKNGRLELPSYGDGTFTGTATKLLAVDADGKVIEEDLPTPGDSLTITDNDQVEAENVNTINFIGATVTDNEDGSVDVEYISGGSSVTIGTDGQIPFVNSDEDDFEYSGNLTYNGASLMNGSNVYMNHNGFQVLATGYNTDIGQYSIHQALNNPGTNPTISIENTGTGDAGIGFLAGSRGVTMGIDNSDGDLFKISVGSSIPNVGAGTVILEADNNQIKLPIYGSGTITGTATKLLAVDADGKVIEEDLPSGGSSLTVTDSDEVEAKDVNTINFIGATVTDNQDGSVDVEYSTTQTVKQAKVTINPLDFRSISSNPIVIVPAEGAGTVVNIIGATAFLDYNSSAFNFSGDVFLRVGNNPSWSMDSADVNAVADNYISFKAPTESSSSVGNSSVVITSGSDSLAGNSDITIIVTYTVDDYN